MSEWVGGTGRATLVLPLGSHVLDLDRGKADLETRLLRVLDRSVLLFVLLHLIVHHACRLADDLLEEDDCAFPRAHAKHEAIVDVLDVLRPRELHQVQHLEELCCVQILLRRDDVDHLVELVLFVALDRSADVAR